MTHEVERYFDRNAAAFDELYALSRRERWFNRVFRRAVYQRFALTFEHAGDVRGKRILDAGCGSGRYAVEFARRGAAEVVGVDLAEGMLELARALAEQAGVAGQCRFVRTDLMTFADRPFDVSIAIGVFDYVEDPVGFLGRLRSLTNGKILASFPSGAWPRAPLRRLRYGLRGVRVHFYGRSEVDWIGRRSGLASWRILPLPAGHYLVGETMR